ncbi:MAG: heparinase II/III family protein [Planctomycetota bacterium]
MVTLRVSPADFRAGCAAFPELERARRNRRQWARGRPGCQILRAVRRDMRRFHPIPDLPHTEYRRYLQDGDRAGYEHSYFARRYHLAAAAVGHFLAPDPALLAAVHDYLWAICEETTWIAPAHERGGMDLFATETAFALAETLVLLGGEIAGEIRERVRHEIERQVVGPYLAGAGRVRRGRVAPGEENLTARFLGRRREGIPFFKYYNNWNGVCNGSVGAVLLHLESDPERLARGVNLVLESLEYFLAHAFGADGASNEGAAYWQYGLVNVIAFSELLRAHTGGRVDFLAHPRMRRIAEYPLKVLLSPRHFYNPADCPTRVAFEPGVISRLADRTGVRDLRSLLPTTIGINYRLPMVLRNLLWWDGRRGTGRPVDDVLLAEVGVFRVRSGRTVLAGKAGFNRESHNHNDVGSFVVHAAGEDLLCDPGSAPYTRWYFEGRTRYKLFVHTQSLGHSVPVVAGKLQEFGLRYRGRIVRFEPGRREKSVEIAFARAYPVKNLRSLRRRLTLAPGGQFVLMDRIVFSGRGAAIEEGFVTWLPVAVTGRRAVIRGKKSTLVLNLTGPAGARFRMERLALDRKSANGSARHAGETLWRLTVRLTAGRNICFSMTGVVRSRQRRGRKVKKRLN